ncbi:MAG: DUF3078 domain-containing protein [candidate division Zixibacteria bacterium]|nr:DUF3078 domain-containing protein [candidate division Zixibacteria bacterium]
MSFMKTTGILIVAMLLPMTTPAQEENPDNGTWKTSLQADVTTTQTSYSDSWVGGEAGSVNWVSNLNGSAQKQLSPWFDLKSTLKVSFGQTLTQDAETKTWSKPNKSTDLIDWETVGSFTLHKVIDPYVAFRLETQFFDGADPAKKLFFSPMRFTESAGITRKFFEKDKDVVSSRLGLGLRQTLKTIILDAQLNTTDSTLTDGGIESVTDVTLSINDRLKYTGKLTLYKAFFFSESDKVKGTPFEDDWKAVDVNWENIVSTSITKIITVNLYTQLLYDKEVSKKGRFKETLALGFVFKML